MKNDYLRRLKISAAAIERKRTFFMPLVYFNAAKISCYNFSKSIKIFEEHRDWFVKNIEKLQDIVEQYGPREVTAEIEEFIDQWPEGDGLDIEGAMEEIHPILAESLSYYFNFVTNSVAAVESCTNLKIATLLHSGKLTINEIKDWESKGIGDRPLHLLAWLEKPSHPSNELKAALEVFRQAVKTRNRFVHYEFTPTTFTYKDIGIENIIGDQHINESFCESVLDATHMILTSLTATDYSIGLLAFDRFFIDFRQTSSPSPYLLCAL